jgi:ketosteroid isomerase-like protein
MTETAALHEDLVRRFVAALNDRDAQALIALVTDDIVWQFPGRNALAGSHRGIPAVAAFLQGVARGMGGFPTLEVHDILANDRHAVELTKISLERGGRTDVWWTFRAYHFRDGRISEIFATTDEQAFLDDLIGRA